MKKVSGALLIVAFFCLGFAIGLDIYRGDVDSHSELQRQIKTAALECEQAIAIHGGFIHNADDRLAKGSVGVRLWDQCPSITDLRILAEKLHRLAGE